MAAFREAFARTEDRCPVTSVSLKTIRSARYCARCRHVSPRWATRFAAWFPYACPRHAWEVVRGRLGHYLSGNLLQQGLWKQQACPLRHEAAKQSHVVHTLHMGVLFRDLPSNEARYTKRSKTDMWRWTSSQCWRPLLRFGCTLGPFLLLRRLVCGSLASSLSPLPPPPLPFPPEKTGPLRKKDRCDQSEFASVGKANDDLRSSTEQMLNSVKELQAQIATEFETIPSIVWARHLWLHSRHFAGALKV